MTIDQNELETLKQLTADERFYYFMESVLETREIWSLCGTGWATFLDEAQGIQLFPLWSDKDLAQANAVGNWQGFEPKAFTMQQLIEELAPELAQADFQFSVFKFPEDSGRVIKAENLVGTLKEHSTSS